MHFPIKVTVVRTSEWAHEIYPKYLVFDYYQRMMHNAPALYSCRYD
jgi:hypothetical protein